MSFEKDVTRAGRGYLWFAVVLGAASALLLLLAHL